MSEMPTVDNVDSIRAIAAPAAPKTPQQLKALAAQFESLLVGQMLREMRQSMFSEDEGKENGMGSGPLADTLFSELSVALSRAGGFGLGQSLIGPLMEQAGVRTTEEGGFPTADSLSLPSVLEAPNVVVPMPGRVSSAYGWRKDPIDGQLKFHKGMDLAMPVGGNVPAAESGEVAFTGDVPGYGLTVVVKHDGHRSTRYAHLSEILVQQGTTVGAGETIARSGATGRTTGPHLHFEVIEGGQPVDPAGEW